MLYEPAPMGRICYLCGIWKPRAELVKNKKRLYGVVTRCIDCHNARNRELYDPEKARVRRIEFAERHPDSAKESHRLDHIKHKTEHIIYNNGWRERNQDKVRASKRKSEEKRRTQNGDFTNEEWGIALTYWHGCCAVCGKPPGLWHTIAQDHWIPVAKGGSYTSDNIIPLCHSIKGGEGGCNNSKGYSDAAAWLTERFGQRKAQQIEARVQEYFAHVKSRNP